MKKVGYGEIVLYVLLAGLGMFGAVQLIWRYASGDLLLPTGQLVIPAIGWIVLYVLMAVAGVVLVIKSLKENENI